MFSKESELAQRHLVFSSCSLKDEIKDDNKFMTADNNLKLSIKYMKN